MKTTEITNTQDVIDSRDIIARIDYLEGTKDKEERAELKLLNALAEDGESASSDWKYGATLVRESYFEDYARELAEELGYIKKEVAWPHTCIDWEQAAEELQQDYTSVNFDNVLYYTR